MMCLPRRARSAARTPPCLADWRRSTDRITRVRRPRSAQLLAHGPYRTADQGGSVDVHGRWPLRADRRGTPAMRARGTALTRSHPARATSGDGQPRDPPGPRPPGFRPGATGPAAPRGAVRAPRRSHDRPGPPVSGDGGAGLAPRGAPARSPGAAAGPGAGRVGHGLAVALVALAGLASGQPGPRPASPASPAVRTQGHRPCTSTWPPWSAVR